MNHSEKSFKFPNSSPKYKLFLLYFSASSLCTKPSLFLFFTYLCNIRQVSTLCYSKPRDRHQLFSIEIININIAYWYSIYILAGTWSNLATWMSLHSWVCVLMPNVFQPNKYCLRIRKIKCFYSRSTGACLQSEWFFLGLSN